jgi:peptide-methionine (S)-S-oxide reductase
MSWRFAAVSIAALVLIGLGSLTLAEQGPGSGRGALKGNGGSAEQPLLPADEPATPGQDVAPVIDPFDAAAGKAAKSGTRSGSSPDTAGTSRAKTEKATFGAGCFWHVEEAFEWLPGVKSAVSGYAGGSVRNPSYEEVHEGMTGHAEVVQVEYDPSVISYEQLLKVFWSCHDPTQLNRQGPDVGPQYRSVIFFHNPDQREAALKSYRELTTGRAFSSPIVTQLVPLRAFYRAEEYHQNYYGGKDGPRAGSTRTRRTRQGASRAKPAMPARQPATSATAKVPARQPAGDGSPRASPGRISGGQAGPE